MKKLTIIICLLLAAPAIASQNLTCDSERSLLTAHMAGYSLAETSFVLDGEIILDNSHLSATGSNDMYMSDRFHPTSPYPTYSLGEVRGCHYLLALPGGDMRGFNFTGLLHKWGDSCNNEEIELNCFSN